jgi:hypothetical protein
MVKGRQANYIYLPGYAYCILGKGEGCKIPAIPSKPCGHHTIPFILAGIPQPSIASSSSQSADGLYTVKKFSDFPVPSQDVTYQTLDLAGNNLIIPRQGKFSK